MSEHGPTLERLESLEIRLYRVITRSHLTIGSGEAAGELRPVDKPIIRALICDSTDRTEQRIPYIPASSLHGVWRAWVEKALRSQTPERPDLEAALTRFREQWKELAPVLERSVKSDLVLPAAHALDRGNLPESWHIYRTVCNPFWEHDKCDTPVEQPSGRDASLPQAKSAWAKPDMADLERGPCRACSIFGHPGQRGRVRFTHAYTSLKESDPKRFPVDIITRVAINRITGAADSGKLFDVEAVPAGVVFYFFVIMENMTARQVEHFEYGCRALNLNLASLGAHGTVGFGLVNVELVGKPFQCGPGIFHFDPDAYDLEELKSGWRSVAGHDYPWTRFPKFLNLLTLVKDGGTWWEEAMKACLTAEDELEPTERGHQ
jgi:CRISPR/Cas system CSM-associated protein Csm3 (group 7 of RAMP superfamily)